MLLKNYVVEEKLMNGSMGTVIDIVYDDARGSRVPGALPLYVVVVDFPESILSYSLIPGSPPTHIPIPITTDRSNQEFEELARRRCCRKYCKLKSQHQERRS